MEGKKIAFIVVSIVAVGGIGYYLYKRNKANLLANENLEDVKKPILSKQAKLKEIAKITSNVKHSVQELSPIYVDNAYDGGGRS